MRKTIFALAAAFVLFTTFGCGKDDDSKMSIVGTWTLESQSTKYYEGTSTTPVDEDVYDPSVDGVATFNFKDNGTLVTVSAGEADSTGYTYDPDNKKMTFTDSGSGVGLVFDITTLTSASLKLHNEYGYTDDNITYKIVTDISLRR